MALTQGPGLTSLWGEALIRSNWNPAPDLAPTSRHAPARLLGPDLWQPLRFLYRAWDEAAAENIPWILGRARPGLPACSPAFHKERSSHFFSICLSPEQIWGRRSAHGGAAPSRAWDRAELARSVLGSRRSDGSVVALPAPAISSAIPPEFSPSWHIASHQRDCE